MKWKVPLDNTFSFSQKDNRYNFQGQATQPTSFLIGESARLDFIFQPQTDEQEYYIKFYLQKMSYLKIMLINSVAQSQKITLEINLQGEHAQAHIKGMYIVSGQQSFALNTIQHHWAPRTESYLTINGIINDSGKAFYDGLIQINQNAHHSIAKQQNKNILLSVHARAESKPNLQVLTNDVHCTHGSAIGQLDSNHLFYMQSRGVEKQRAEQLLLQGFLSHIVDDFPEDMIHSIEQRLFHYKKVMP